MKTTDLFVTFEYNLTENITSEEEYGDWYRKYEYTVTGVHIQKPKGSEYEILCVLDSVKLGDEVYVVYVTHSDGDSFGSAHGIGELLWVFTSLDDAKLLTDKMKECSSDYMFEVMDHNGNKIRIPNPAYDYFTNIEDTFIFSTTVQ